MGGALDQRALVAFADELEQIKKAGAPQWLFRMGDRIRTQLAPRAVVKTMGRVGEGIRTNLWGPSDISLGVRASKPLAGLKAGWDEMSNVAGLSRSVRNTPVAEGAKETFRGLEDFAARATPEQRQAALKGFVPGLSLGEHLLAPSQTMGKAWSSGGVRGTAEELSRRGVTGAGRITKYLPVGQKALIPGFSAMAIPSIVNAPKATPTGEGGAVERGLGEAAGLGGMIFTGGLGPVPGLAGWWLASKAGGRIGRVIDRLRAGGTMDQAVSAPSPEEAAQQLERIQKHYG
jgi:hypothetical protein